MVWEEQERDQETISEVKGHQMGLSPGGLEHDRETNKRVQAPLMLDPSGPSLECGCMELAVWHKFQGAACFAHCEETTLLNEDLCFNTPPIPPRQIYLPLHQPRPPHLSQQPFLLAWHLCLCSVVIVDLYFDSMHLRILLMWFFLRCAYVHTAVVCACVCVFLCQCVSVCVLNRSY